jgi:hypothetical protein
MGELVSEHTLELDRIESAQQTRGEHEGRGALIAPDRESPPERIVYEEQRRKRQAHGRAQAVDEIRRPRNVVVLNETPAETADDQALGPEPDPGPDGGSEYECYDETNDRRTERGADRHCDYDHHHSWERRYGDCAPSSLFGGCLCGGGAGDHSVDLDGCAQVPGPGSPGRRRDAPGSRCLLPRSLPAWLLLTGCLPRPVAVRPPSGRLSAFRPAR